MPYDSRVIPFRLVHISSPPTTAIPPKILFEFLTPKTFSAVPPPFSPRPFIRIFVDLSEYAGLLLNPPTPSQDASKDAVSIPSLCAFCKSLTHYRITPRHQHGPQADRTTPAYQSFLATFLHNRNPADPSSPSHREGNPRPSSPPSSCLSFPRTLPPPTDNPIHSAKTPESRSQLFIPPTHYTT